MGRPVTLFTGQWTDLPLEQVAKKAGGWGFDGLELASSGDHFNVQQALDDPDYIKSRWDILNKYGLRCYAISNHLVGQAVCDIIDDRHKSILPEYIWGDGEPEGVRQRAAKEMMDTARAAARFGVSIVTGFTGSSIWPYLYSFPPNDFGKIEQGYRDFADRWEPIMDVFEQEGVKFALEVHPTEIAYDFVTTEKTLKAIGNHPNFGVNFDPSHLIPQFLEPVAFLEEFGDCIYHVHIKDAKRRLNGRRSILGSHLNFGGANRGWDFVSPGHGDVDFKELFRALNRIGYTGPVSVEWEDTGVSREWGAPDALQFVRRYDFAPSDTAFDAAFRRK